MRGTVFIFQFVLTRTNTPRGRGVWGAFAHRVLSGIRWPGDVVGRLRRGLVFPSTPGKGREPEGLVGCVRAPGLDAEREALTVRRVGRWTFRTWPFGESRQVRVSDPAYR